MQLSEELELSYYKDVAEINSHPHIKLVQDTRDGKFYCKKELSSYNAEIFCFLRDHPVRNMPRIYVVVEDDGVLTVIEDYIQGDTVQERLDRDGPMKENDAVDLVIRLCEILSRLHHQDPPIVHRDIKPSNLIISPDGTLTLVDMNTAKYADPDEARDTKLMGTSGYAAPEQYGFGASDARTDLYAVGVLLNVLITGRFPAEKKAPGGIGEIVSVCTELKPEDRFDDVDALKLILEDYRREGKLPNPKSGRRKDSSPRRFLPPGFRTGSVPKMIIAVLGYALIIVIGLTLYIGVDSQVSLIINRIVLTLTMLAIVFFAADYDGIQDHLPITRSSNTAVRVLGIILYSILLIVVVLLLLFIFEEMIFPPG